MKKILLITAALAILLFLVSGCERKVVNQASNDANTTCFMCHNGDGRIETADAQWRNSLHGSGRLTFDTNRSGCSACHTQPGFIEQVNTGGTASAPYANITAIGCHTCHMPHESGNLDLRTTAAVALLDGSTFDHGEANLCASCHHSRLAVSVIADAGDSISLTSSRWGPHHGPQGDLINGTNAYEYAGVTYPTSSPHAAAITNACIGCHMGSAVIEEGYKVGGHSWNMVDAADESINLADNCVACHESMPEGAASYDEMTVSVNWNGADTTVNCQSFIVFLSDSLQTLLVADSLLTSSGSVITQTVEAGKAGAIYNLKFIQEDRSEGIHNYPYSLALLTSAIDYLNDHPAP